jgi:hypothetical protein
MKKRVWISLLLLLLVVFVATSTLLVLKGNWLAASTSGFSVISLQDSTVLLSDGDVVSYNLTSQEIALTNSASQRLTQVGDSLYSYSPGVSVRINGEEIYQGIFRLATMSAVPSAPKIAILFPSVDLPSGATNNHAIRLFYPDFRPPSDLSDMNSKFANYFEETNRLAH